MKNTFRYMAAAAAILAAASCTKQEINAPEKDNAPEGTYQYILNVTQENDSKVSMDGLSILWDKDDKIGVSCTYIDADGKNQYGSVSKSGGIAQITDRDNYTPATSAQFTLNFKDDFEYTPHSAGYPCKNESMKITSGSGDNKIRMDIDIAAEQVGIPDNIPAQALGMVGRITDGECQMHNVGAVIKFEIANEDITSLRFEGNNSEIISGERYYYVNSGEFAYEKHKSDKVTVVGTTSVTLVPSDGVFVPGVYYFVVAPNTLEDGFTMTLTNSVGQKAIRKTSTKFEIKRNHKYTQFGSDKGWFKNVYTLNAGDLGSADGTTATLYGIVTPDEVEDGDTYGFEISTDGVNWTQFEGSINKRFSSVTHATASNPLNVFTANLTGIAPETTMYYRAFYQKADTGVITYGKSKSFQTYSEAESVKIDLYNGWSEGYWPFTNLTYGTDLNSGKKEEANFKKVDLTLTTSTGSFIAKATNGFWLNMYNGCLTFNPAKGEYLKFPVIAGKKPLSVVMTIGSTNGKNLGLPAVHKMTGSETTLVVGGNQWDGTTADKYDTQTWNLINTDDGQYGLCFNSANNCYISYLEVVYVDAETDTRPATIEQDLVFSTRIGEGDGEPKWPFTTSQGSHNSVTSPVGPFYTSSQPDMIYYFHVTNPAAANTNWRTTAGQGLRFGGTIGDYMQICPVADYKLTKIKIRGGTAGFTFSITDAEGNIVSGGKETKISSTADSVLEFVLEDTIANTEYRLTHATTTQSAIREMWITYELVK